MKEEPPPNTKFGSAAQPWARFTSDWHSHRVPAWRKHLLPDLVGKPVNCLEVGSYEGRSAIWALTNMLTHPDARLTCVDIWKSTETERRFDENLVVAGFSTKVRKIKGASQTILRSLHGPYDFVYVDGDHQAKSALADVVTIWPTVKKGGYVVFDDYKWSFPTTDPERDNKIPACEGIDAFLKFWASELRVVDHDYQVIIQKL